MSADGAGVFDATADDYDLDGSHAVVADQLVAGLRLIGPAALVVDVATGTGVAALSALRRLSPTRVVAVDLASRMLDRARAKAVHDDPDGRIEWRRAPAVPLDIDDESADVVLCASSLHFLGRAALDEWLRVLRPGGQVAFSLPAADDFRPAPPFRRLLAEDLPIPRTGSEAAAAASGAGFRRVRVHRAAAASTGRPRRPFLVWADAPPQTPDRGKHRAGT